MTYRVTLKNDAIKALKHINDPLFNGFNSKSTKIIG